MAPKRTLDAFFEPRTRKAPRVSPAPISPPALRVSTEPAPAPVTQQQDDDGDLPPSTHASYPFPIANFPSSLIALISSSPSDAGTHLDQERDLDIVHYSPYVPWQSATSIFTFLRRELPFYRVQYTIHRGSVATQVNTPRYTTVFGVDESARFSASGELVSAATGAALPTSSYSCTPRPIPACLEALRILTEASTGSTFNFALVNYYASGNDSISYHSDDERFLGDRPSIASFSFGAVRDFCLKHKPAPNTGLGSEKTIKLSLNSGDMVLMQGATQSRWLHSIPKRKGAGAAEQGRINITFRKALVKPGTENYYRYNVGTGAVWRWDQRQRKMVELTADGKGEPSRD